MFYEGRELTLLKTNARQHHPCSREIGVCVGGGGGGLCISVCVLIFALSLLPPCECEAACLCIVDPFTVRALVFFGYCALAAQDVNSLFLYRQHLQKPNIKS